MLLSTWMSPLRYGSSAFVLLALAGSALAQPESEPGPGSEDVPFEVLPTAA